VSSVAIVTGAARGIGAACVDALVADGVNVVAVDRCRDDASIPYALGTKAELDAVVARHGTKVLGLVGDVRSQADMNLAVETALEHFGRLDIVVACAGIVIGGTLSTMSDEAYNTVMEVNLGGVRRIFSAAIPAILSQTQPRHGRLIAISSAAGKKGHDLLTAYCASKHGVIGLAKALAAELSSEGITVNTVCPGSTNTPILAASAQIYGLASVDEFIVHQPLGRLLAPSEVAAMVAWVASPQASGVTGDAISVDGGMTAI